MIMHTLFIKCCTIVPRNSQLLFVLVNLARGGEFVYKDTATRVGSKDMYVTKNGQVYTYTFLDKPIETLAADVQRLYDIKQPVSVDEKTVKEYMLRDYVVDSITRGDIAKRDAPFLLSYIFLCHILKLFSAKDMSMENGRIGAIANIDVHKYTISNITMRSEQRMPKVKRMDVLWLKNN